MIKNPQVISLVITNVPNIKIEEGDNKIPDLKSLVNKRIYNAKISEIVWKYFTASDHNKFTSGKHDAQIKQI